MRKHHILWISVLAAIFILMVGMMACEGETITIERATEESERSTRARPTPTEGPESTRRSVFSTGGTPTVVPTASGRIAFPLLSDGAALTATNVPTAKAGWLPMTWACGTASPPTVRGG